MTSDESRPQSITGGCLCGSIRYTVSFPPDAEWPPSHNATCQCTQCRKTTGALLPQFLELPARTVSPNLTHEDATLLPTYRIYASSAHGRRGFCAKCGSSLMWSTDERPDVVEVPVGSLDEDVLLGKVVGDDGEDEYGARRKRTGGWGRELAVPRGHNFVENAVPGVTDGMAGPKYLTVGNDGKKSFEGALRDIGRA